MAERYNQYMERISQKWLEIGHTETQLHMKRKNMTETKKKKKSLWARIININRELCESGGGRN